MANSRPNTDQTRLPDYAELTFARACAFAGAIAHPPWKDENGWDYLVEFAPLDDPRPADLHEPTAKAWAQVKSSQGDGLQCKVKLSNLLKSAQSRDPWFIVSIARDSSGVKIYAKHIWEDLIERTLREVRKTEMVGRRLNRRQLTLKFSPDDARTEADLLRWMRSCISSIPYYEQKKKQIYTSIGFEDGTAVGTIVFKDATPSALARAFLGLSDGVPGSGTLTPSRFGMPDHRNKLNFEGQLFITPISPDREVEIRLRSEQSSRQLIIPGKSYSLAFLAGGPWVRFSAGGFEILASAGGENSFERTLDKPEALGDLENIGLLSEWLSLGKVDLEIWWENKRRIATTISANIEPRMAGQWKLFAQIVGLLVRLAGSHKGDMKLSIDEVANSRELVLFYHMVTAPSVRIEFQPLAAFPKALDRGLYYVWIDIADLTAYCVVERKLHRFKELESGEIQLDFEGPRVVDSWIVKDADDDQRTTMRKDYDATISKLNARDIKVIDLGDIRNFWHERKVS